MLSAPRWPIVRRALLVFFCLAVGAHSAAPPTPFSRLAHAAERMRPRVAARLSVSPDHFGPAHSTEYATAAPASAVLAHAEPGGGDPATALHLAGLVDLVWADRNAASRAVQSLEAAVRVRHPSAALLADLAAAHLARAELARTPLDLQSAVEAAEDALRRDSENRAALFNRALALDRLGVEEQAARAWRAMLRVDSASAWADTARARLRALSAARPVPPPPGAGPAALAAFAARDPQEARHLAMEGVLGEWGEAVLRGDTARAAARLRAAEAVAAVLADRTVADAARAAGRADPAGRLARAHAVYARAQRASRARDGRAPAAFDSAAALAGESPGLAAWARFHALVARFYAGRAAGAEPAFRAMAAAADTARHPALAGRALWSLGTVLLRRGAYEEARDVYGAAARHFGRAGEREHRGAVESLQGEAHFALGDEQEAYAALEGAMGTLRPFRASVVRHNLLYVAAQAAAVRGASATALHLQNEGVAVAARLRPAVHAEALLARARARVRAGDRTGARADIAASRPLVAALPEGLERSWHEADLRLADALSAPPAHAAEALDSVVAFFAAARVTPRLLPALAARAEARLAAGHPAGAVADLDSAARLLDGLSGKVDDVAVRASVLAASAGVFDRLAMAHARAERPAHALAALERGRASNGRTPTGALAAPPGMVALEYALVGDTLLAFVVRGPGVHLVRRTVGRETLAHAAERARLALERPADADSARGALAALYDHLIRPVRHHLPPGTPLAVVADGEIAAVPFAALLDTAAGRYLVEDHPVRFARSVRDLRHPRPGAPIQGGAVFVVDPAFDWRAHPGLQRLPATGVGTRAVAASYPGARVIAGDEADPERVAAALVGASLFHFAGHAVFDEARPQRSYLVLAPGDGRGRLQAAELARMDLRGVRLVVLSACQTQRAVGGRAGGFAGLSGALLAAGAGGVVGSEWRVDDALTRALMSELHAAYRVTGDGAAALHQAQLRLLRSSDPALRSPAAWAGFRFAGD
jgi:CHAT domain-containing protein/tetratricopeptide (TPR) repeat protein